MNTDQGLEFKGPILKYEWVPNKHEHITLIAGGTGKHDMNPSFLFPSPGPALQ